MGRRVAGEFARTIAACHGDALSGGCNTWMQVMPSGAHILGACCLGRIMVPLKNHWGIV